MPVELAEPETGGGVGGNSEGRGETAGGGPGLELLCEIAELKT